MQSRSESLAWRGVAAAMMSWCVVACLPVAAREADPGESQPAAAATRSRTIVDPAVVPAGGMHCRHCGTGACRVHGGHLAGCRNGMCHPHCPVRPMQYGFYHTQWRRWPGEGVVPASAEEAATPVAPPASQVPTIEEESPSAAGAKAADGDTPGGAEPEADPSAADRSAEDQIRPVDPIPEQAPRAAPATEQPAAEPPVPPTPPGDAPATPAKEAAEDDLFDQSAAPLPDAEIPLDAGAMRYPAPVGRSLVAGIPPWRLAPRAGQRAAASARGR